MLIPGAVQPIKIGFTTNPEQRKYEYNGGPYRCKWLGEWPGDRKDEQGLHDQFQRQRMNGEWFSPCPEMLDLIQQRLAAFWTLQDACTKADIAGEAYREAELWRAAEVLSKTALA